MSLYHMTPEQIVESSNFVKEPVQKIITAIDSSSCHEVVLTGPRSGGKSIVMNAYQKEKVGTGEDAVYVFLDSSINVSYLTDRELSYRYELYLAGYVLSYIRKNYRDLYEENFVKLHDEIKFSSQKFLDFINTKAILIERNQKFSGISPRGKLIEKVITEMKKYLGSEAITICLDRFDWMNSSNDTFQKMAAFYFQFFDKVILTSDDKEIVTDFTYKRSSLSHNGVDFIDVDYGKNYNIAKEIVTADLAYYASAKHTMGNSFENRQYVDIKKLIPYATYNKMIKNCDGNFGILFQTLREFYGLGDIDDGEHIRKILKYNRLVVENYIAKEKRDFPKRLYRFK